MATHVFRSASGQDLFSFRILNIVCNSDKKIRYMINYQDVVILNDISGYLMKEDGETVDFINSYTVKTGTHLNEYSVYYTIEKNGNKYLSICIEDEDDLFEVRVNI